jgi:hypothetical protein
MPFVQPSYTSCIVVALYVAKNSCQASENAIADANIWQYLSFWANIRLHRRQIKKKVASC